MRILAALFLAWSALAQTPVGLYTLAFVEVVPGPAHGCTNWQFLVRTDINAVPVAVIETKATKVAVSNLQYGLTYYLSVKGQSNGVWSVESTNYVWPHAREDYAAFWQENKATGLAIPGTLSTVTNGPPWTLRALKVGVSNNITPYVQAQ